MFEITFEITLGKKYMYAEIFSAEPLLMIYEVNY